jgi:Xaa-Pro aminopeptidase
VVTIEPGLYYPDSGFGVRVEDLFIVTEKGELISHTPFRKDLVLPLRG